jgi:hypothetical protein
MLLTVRSLKVPPYFHYIFLSQCWFGWQLHALLLSCRELVAGTFYRNIFSPDEFACIEQVPCTQKYMKSKNMTNIRRHIKQHFKAFIIAQNFSHLIHFIWLCNNKIMHWWVPCSGMWHCECLVGTDILEAYINSVFRMERISELGMTALTSNRSTLWRNTNYMR